jgi:hypothetical protein
MAVPLIVPVLVRAGLADDVLDLPPGDESIEEGLDHLLVGVGQMLDGLELAQEIAVGDAGGSGFVAGALEQVIAGGVERVGETRDEDIILDLLNRLEIQPPDSDVLRRFGHIRTPADVIRLIEMAHLG